MSVVLKTHKISLLSERKMKQLDCRCWLWSCAIYLFTYRIRSKNSEQKNVLLKSNDYWLAGWIFKPNRVYKQCC